MRTRHLIAASGAALAIAVAGAAGIASADGPTAPAVRTITVMGDASAPVSCGKHGATNAEKVYRQALAEALDEAKDKATFLAGHVGASLGPVQSLNENSSAGDPCGGPIAIDTGVPVDDSGASVAVTPDAPVTSSPPSVGGAPVPEQIDGGAATAKPDIAPVPQPAPQVWASVSVTYVIS